MTLSPSLPLSPSLSPPSSARPALARPVFMPSVVAAAAPFISSEVVWSLLFPLLPSRPFYVRRPTDGLSTSALSENGPTTLQCDILY